MGREQRRKQQKNYKNVVESDDFNLFTVSGTVKTIVGLIVVLLLSYFVLAFFVTKEIKFNNDGNSSNGSDSSSNVSNQILAANVFLQNEDSYYVYFYDFGNEDDRISSNINNITDYTVYRVNTESGFNSRFVTSDAGNSNAKGIDDLKVKAPTLIKVSNDTIVEYYEGVNNIMKAVN